MLGEVEERGDVGSEAGGGVDGGVKTSEGAESETGDESGRSDGEPSATKDLKTVWSF